MAALQQWSVCMTILYTTCMPTPRITGNSIADKGQRGSARKKSPVSSQEVRFGVIQVVKRCAFGQRNSPCRVTVHTGRYFIKRVARSEKQTRLLQQHHLFGFAEATGRKPIEIDSR